MRPSTLHLCHAPHHNFTTKTPRYAHRFSRNTLINTTFHHAKKTSNFYPEFRIRLLSKTEGKRKLLGI